MHSAASCQFFFGWSLVAPEVVVQGHPLHLAWLQALEVVEAGAVVVLGAVAPA